MAPHSQKFALLDQETLYIRDNVKSGYHEAKLVRFYLCLNWNRYSGEGYSCWQDISISSDRVLQDSLLYMQRRGWVDDLYCWWTYRSPPPDQAINKLYDDVQLQGSGGQFKIVGNEIVLYNDRLNAATAATETNEVKKKLRFHRQVLQLSSHSSSYPYSDSLSSSYSSSSSSRKSSPPTTTPSQSRLRTRISTNAEPLHPRLGIPKVLRTKTKD